MRVLIAIASTSLVILCVSEVLAEPAVPAVPVGTIAQSVTTVEAPQAPVSVIVNVLSPQELLKLGKELEQARVDAKEALRIAEALAKKADDAVKAAEGAKTDAEKIRTEMIAIRAEQAALRAASDSFRKEQIEQRKALELRLAQIVAQIETCATRNAASVGGTAAQPARVDAVELPRSGGAAH
jgi:hypothetical protein